MDQRAIALGFSPNSTEAGGTAFAYGAQSNSPANYNNYSGRSKQNRIAFFVTVDATDTQTHTVTKQS